MMYVSMFQIIFELEDIGSIKDKRRIVHSIRDRLIRRFKISCAEIDLQDSLSFAQIGGAVVSNSREYGEKVMQNAVTMIENSLAVRIHDLQISSECVSS